MGRVAYVNGSYVPHSEAAVHIEDRGYQFADGVYEVTAVYQGKLIDEQGHAARLDRSLRELQIAWPVKRRVFGLLMREVIRRNRLTNGSIYVQVTRGVAPRNHNFPKGVPSSLVMTTTAKDLDTLLGGEPTQVITVPDIRWGRPDIKSIALLPNCLAKQKAGEAGCYEAWQVDKDGCVTEGTLSNAWIVNAAGELVTRNADENAILNGITRQAVMELAQTASLRVVERPFSVDEALAAREAFLTSTTSFVKPVVRIDGKPVGDGAPGSVTRQLGVLIGERLAAAVR
ncbi:MAG: D-amino-acid transaminase [Alphaproteobacteria bacterium]|nr:D-amino-acid transaminase [Alphaproteobacteria bacterium]